MNYGLKIVNPHDETSFIFNANTAPEKHLIGKIFTQRIERHNRNLRIHIKRLARRTICYSRSMEIHEKLIGAYIEKHYYNPLGHDQILN
ncbi:IS1 family transposase [Xenorhabdus bovienii]|uniref:IS1 family transposase n=1 Tax=Xenorhabdus bovienii TaxID=40576 RepID=UPI0023B21E56|nr:IS1 family transposase [Xenorhabdus bovienii]